MSSAWGHIWLLQWKCCEQINRCSGHDYVLIIQRRKSLLKPRERCRTSLQIKADSDIGYSPASGPAGSRAELVPYAAQVFQIKSSFALFPCWLTQLALNRKRNLMVWAQKDAFLLRLSLSRPIAIRHRYGQIWTNMTIFFFFFNQQNNKSKVNVNFTFQIFIQIWPQQNSFLSVRHWIVELTTLKSQLCSG